MKKRKNVKLILFLVFILGFVFSFSYTYKSLFIREEVEPLVTIMIDPGHGGYDPGSISQDGVYEKDITLSLALQTGKMIQQMEPRIRVVYTRTTDNVPWPNEEYLDLAYRVSMAQEQMVNYYFAIHCDAAENLEATGYSFYIRDGDEFSTQMCHAITDNLIKVHWSNSLGIDYTYNRPLYVVDNQTIPAILFEAGYISNAREGAKLQAWYNQKLIAYSLAKGIVESIQKTWT